MLNVFGRQSRETTRAIASGSLMLHTCTDIALHVMCMLARKSRAQGVPRRLRRDTSKVRAT